MQPIARLDLLANFQIISRVERRPPISQTHRVGRGDWSSRLVTCKEIDSFCADVADDGKSRVGVAWWWWWCDDECCSHNTCCRWFPFFYTISLLVTELVNRWFPSFFEQSKDDWKTSLLRSRATKRVSVLSHDSSQLTPHTRTLTLLYTHALN